MKEQVKEQPKPVPFFVRFLEQQEALSIETGVKAGKTMKYPSDSDELNQTMKAPSDSDEI
jgi:hypothetical protein